jgi:hypothetical protein
MGYGAILFTERQRAPEDHDQKRYVASNSGLPVFCC